MSGRCPVLLRFYVLKGYSLFFVTAMPAKPAQNHFACLVALLMIATLLWAGCADAQVYQCTQADGVTRYQGHPCASHTNQQPVELHALNRMATTPVVKSRKTTRTRSRKPQRASVGYTQRAVKACAAAHRRLDHVQSQLRAGYSAKRGRVLKRKRDALDDKRRDVCDGVPQHVWMALR